MSGARLRGVGAALVLALSALACGGSTPKPTGAESRKALPPANPVAAAKLAQAAALYKDPSTSPRVIALLREAAALDTSLWEARLNLGIVLADSSDLAGAEAALVEGVRITGDEEDLAIALANVRLRRGAAKLAADGLSTFLATHAGSDSSRALLVMALRDAGQFDEAVKQARLVLTRKPGNALALAELALCHLARNEIEIADLLIKQAIDLNPKSAAAQRALGLIELQRGEDARAFTAFAAAANADSKDTSARLNMGGVLLRAGAYAKAEEQFRAVLLLAKEDSGAKLGLAAARRAQGSQKESAPWEEAKSLLENVLAREPHNISALYNLALLLGEQFKRPRDAAPLLERFLNDAPESHSERREAERLSKLYAESKAATPPAAAAAPAGPSGAKK